jgi:hypothetical protein
MKIHENNYGNDLAGGVKVVVILPKETKKTKMENYKTGEKFKNELCSLHRMKKITFRDALMACRETSCPRLHQGTLEKNAKTINEIRSYMCTYGISLFYPKESDVLRGGIIDLEDELYIFLLDDLR